MSTERPWWMTALAVLCALTVPFLVYRDLFVPHVRDVEVFLGLELRGRAALLSAPLHWAIFAAGAWSLWRAKPWSVPAAAGYLFVVALSHLVWNGTSPRGGGWPMGLLQAAGFSLLGWTLLRARRSTVPR